MEQYFETLKFIEHCAKTLGLKKLENEIIKNTQSLLTQEIPVVFLGEFNHGKSSLINAILNKKTLSVGITPTTQHITRIFFDASEYHAEYYDTLGIKYELPYDSWEDSANALVADTISEICVHLKDKCPAGKNIVFIDTPGVNDLSKQREEVSYKIIPEAGLILFVLDASQALKKSELAFIREGLLSLPKDCLLFVINKCDILDDEELQTVYEYTQSELQKILGDVSIFMASCRPKSRFGIDEIREKIHNYTQTLGFKYTENSANKVIAHYTNLLTSLLKLAHKAIALPKSEIDDKLHEVQIKIANINTNVYANDLTQSLENSVQAVQNWVLHEIEQFKTDFCEAIQREIDKSSIHDLETYFAGFIEEECIQFAHSMIHQIQKKLEFIAQQLLTSLVEESTLGDLSFGVKDTMEKLDFHNFELSCYSPKIILESIKNSALRLINSLSFGIFTRSIPLLPLDLDSKYDTLAKRHFRKLGEEAILALCTSIQNELSKTMDQYIDNLKQFLEDTNGNLYIQLAEILTSIQNNSLSAVQLDSLEKNFRLTFKLVNP